LDRRESAKKTSEPAGERRKTRRNEGPLEGERRGVNRGELRRGLDAHGVNPDAYDLDRTQKDEVYSL